MDSNTLFLVLPVALRRDAQGRLMFERQACNGLDRWADHFARVIAACPLDPQVHDSGSRQTSAEYMGIEHLQARDRIQFVCLPYAYTLARFLKTYRGTRLRLGDCIRQADYLSFAIGGLIGDWAAVACLEAAAQQRRYSVWTDRVEHRVVGKAHLDSRGLKRLVRLTKNRWLLSPLMKRLERHVISRSALGLFHGRDCFDLYRHWASNPHLVHDIHLKSSDRIAQAELDAKISRIKAGQPLRIVYLGRAAHMKGPLDWINALYKARAAGMRFEATWMGDGPLLADMRAAVRGLHLDSCVALPGNVSDRASVLSRLRNSDVMLFCHKTPESPRCLVEALMSGVPPVGYDTPYPRDLLGEHADALLVTLNDIDALARRLLELDGSRHELAAKAQACARLGTHYSDEAVFAHRSELIRANLGPHT